MYSFIAKTTHSDAAHRVKCFVPDDPAVDTPAGDTLLRLTGPTVFERFDAQPGDLVKVTFEMVGQAEAADVNEQVALASSAAGATSNGGTSGGTTVEGSV